MPVRSGPCAIDPMAEIVGEFLALLPVGVIGGDSIPMMFFGSCGNGCFRATRLYDTIGSGAEDTASVGELSGEGSAIGKWLGSCTECGADAIDRTRGVTGQDCIICTRSGHDGGSEANDSGKANELALGVSS